MDLVEQLKKLAYAKTTSPDVRAKILEAVIMVLQEQIDLTMAVKNLDRRMNKEDFLITKN